MGTKFDRRCQWEPTMLVQWSDGSPRAFLGYRLGTDTILAKTVFFDTFFHILAKRVNTTKVTAGKIGSTHRPTGDTTVTGLQLAVSVRYETLSTLQFWVISGTLAFSDVKNESFSGVSLALGSPNFRH